MEIDYTWDLEQENELDSARLAATHLDLEADGPVETESFSLELDHYDSEEQEDKLWQARTGLNFEGLCGTIETLVFMSDRPISLQKIKAQIDEELPLRVLHEAMTHLQKGYEEKHHGIRLAEVAEGYQFRTKATYAKYVQNLFKMQSLVLTPTALEVLAIIAYKQPVSKTEVEKIRGVDSSHIVRALMDKRLVKITGRSEELGRPSLFATTEEFLEVFNLSDISQLPPEHELAELASQTNVAGIADIKSVVFGGDRAKFDVDELEELDQLSASIKDIAAETDFTMLLKQEEKRRIDGDEETPRKSAFDILEEFVLKEESTRQNRMAAESELLMSVTEASAVDVDTDGILNAPVVDMEWEKENLEREAMELEVALEEAFQNLLNDAPAEIEEEALDQQLKTLDFTVDSAIQKGIDMELDLSFLADIQTPDDKSEET